MATIGAYEAKTHLSELLDRVARGERIVITRHGQPVAVLQPPDTATTRGVSEAIAGIRALRGRVRAAPEELAAWAAEGRD